ncbi:MAG: hypothetical protein IJH50_04455 [Kiritimatiellae bacterium]|nr:hypothetical protein [Kiritimatiellia bacterium]
MKNNMYRTIAALATACMTFTAFAATINWKADDSGSWSGDFGDRNHWEGGSVPGSGDEAVFPATTPREFTVTVNAEYTVHKISFVAAARKVTISGTGKISTAYAGSIYNTIGNNTRIILDGASFHSGYQMLLYGTLEVRAGSTFSNGDTFYLWEPYATLVVDGGTCSFKKIQYNETSLNGGIFVKSGSVSSAKELTSTKAGRPAVLDVSGGTVELNSIIMSIPGSKINLSGGTLKVTNTEDGSLAVDEGVDVSLTGGTFSWQHDLSDSRFYATDGADVDIGQKFVMVTNGPVTATSKGALIARGFRNGDVANCVIDGTFPRIVFTYPDGYFWVATAAYNKFYFNGPTTIGATCDMIVNLNHTMTHTYFKGDITVDTLDYKNRTTKRTICTRGLHPTDGEATLTVTGGGTYQLLQSQSHNSFRFVTVESGTTLTLLDRPSSVAYGPLVAETFTMGANSKLTLNAGANHIQAKTFAIDPSVTITVAVPSTFAGAAPILQTTDQTTPSVSLSQITLTGSTSGVLLKNENGQVTIYKPGAVDGTYTSEWIGGGGDNSFSTAANWYGGTLPTSNQIIYFGATTVTNPRWGVISGGGSTVGGYLFRDTATETFNYSSNGETLKDYMVDGSIFMVGTWAGVPQIVTGSLRRDGWYISFGARCAAPLILDGDGTFNWNNNSKRYIRICGDVRLNKNGYAGTGFYFYSPAPTAKTPYTRLTVLPNTTATLSAQVDDFSVASTGVRVETGATLTFGNGDGAFYRWTVEPAKQVINGTLDIQAPFYGGVKQTYGGTGRLNIATVKSGTAASRVQFADGLNVYPGDWTTVTSDADNPVAITAIGGTPTIHLSSNWRYGVASGVTTASLAASRALEVQKGAVLTLDAGGHAATIDEDVSGEGTLVITNGTLAVNSTAASDVTLKVAANGTLAMSDDLNFGSLEMESGSAVSFANGKTVNLSGSADISGATIYTPSSMCSQRGWKTVLVAADGVNVSDCTLPAGFEMRTENVTGGVALQLKYLHGINIIIR